LSGLRVCTNKLFNRSKNPSSTGRENQAINFPQNVNWRSSWV
jgi:hypothetical protein